MRSEDVRHRIKPWMVAAVLGVLGVAGATVVTIAARHQHALDRAQVADFVRDELPALERAHTAEGDLEGLNVALIGPATATGIRSNLHQKRVTLETARQLVLAKPTPDILQRTSAEYVDAIGFTLRAIALLDSASAAKQLPLRGATLTTYKLALRDADAAFARGASLIANLECRVELPLCAHP